MKLYGTPASHFTRKVRVVLQELGLPFEFVVIENILACEPGTFAGNELLQLPILEDASRRIIESDIICEYLLDRHGKSDAGLSLFPREGDPYAHRQRLALMNGGMSAGARLMSGRRSQIPEMEKYPFFQQQRASLLGALAWLEQDLGDRRSYDASTPLTLLEITLVSFAEWALFREMVPSLEAYPNLTKFVAHWRERPSFRATHPAAAPGAAGAK